MTKAFFAHSLPDRPPEDWERLEWHLRRTGALARRFARDFDLAHWGAVIGLLHDLGKYSLPFQQRLFGSIRRVDHSTAGAVESIRRYGNLGYFLAYGIAGHHAGLNDGSGGTEAVLEKRLKRQIEPIYKDWQSRITLPNAEVLQEELYAHLSGVESGFPFSFTTRMLFSALVDADFLATEWFMDRGKHDMRRTRLPKPADLCPILRSWMDKTFGDTPATDISQQRAKILSACREAAAHPPGVFTLAVPTGAGKTLSSLAFALDHAAQHGLKRVIYAIPFTSIIEQTAETFRAALGDAGSDVVLEHHSAAEPKEADEDNLVGPERLHLATENWDAPVVVSTTVQLFDSLFAVKPSRCRKLHNLARAVIVLDEVQALPLNRLAACLACLKELVERYGATVVLCSATVPDLDRPKALKVKLPAPRQIVAPSAAMTDAFRRVRTDHAGDLDDETLANHLLEKDQVMCIVDTRKHAAELFDKMPEEGRFHLSASMYPAHRRATLERIKTALRENRPCRLIATRVVEAGVDISFPEVWRAIAGVDSLAQAAGRCNREGECDGLGRFVIFEPTRPDARPEILPDLRLRAKEAQEVLKHHPDPLNAEAIQAFFGRVMALKTLDDDNIWQTLDKAVEPAQFPFKSVAEKFRMIDDSQQPVWITRDDTARENVEKLRAILAGAEGPQRRPPRDLLRRLQSYAVGVNGIERLKAGGHVRLVHPDDARFHVLADDSFYDDATGLRIDRAGLRDSNMNVL